MKDKYKWDLTEIFESENELENAIDELYKLVDQIKTFKGKLANNVDEIFGCYKTLEKIYELHEKIYAYAMLKYHQDMSSQEGIKLYKRVENITTENI